MTTDTLRNAYRAARQHGYRAAQALTIAHNRLANLAPAEARVAAARAAAGAVVDKRRFAPENAAAQTELRSANHALSEVRRALTPRDAGSLSMALNAPFAIGGHSSAPGHWCENPPFRFVGLASDLARLDHDGWYTDEYGANGERARGVVYQMVGRDGRARFIPGIADPCNSASDGTGPAVLAIGDMETAEGSDEGAAEDAKRAAAYRADQLAEYYAEEEREYQEAWQAGARYAELGEGIVSTRRAILAALAERRSVPAVETPTLCAMLRRRVSDMLEDIAKAREERADLAWNLTRRDSPGDAFRDGAGV